MAVHTSIEYLDSTLNIGVGCDGCELWTKKPVLQPDGTMKLIRTCYAGNLVDRYAGLPGWPVSFDTPTLFLHRLLSAENWQDLRGSKRPDKPWLDGLPRIIFLNDLGDTFTASFPDDYLITPAKELRGRKPLDVLAGLTAIIAMFTKRPDRMLKLFERVECPQNIMPITSITGPETAYRAAQVQKINARWKALSVEPLLRGLGDAIALGEFDWVLAGAESGPNRRPPDFEGLRELVFRCSFLRRTRLFMKQIDKIQEIPPDLLVRQVPAFTLGQAVFA